MVFVPCSQKQPQRLLHHDFDDIIVQHFNQINSRNIVQLCLFGNFEFIFKKKKFPF